MSLKGRVKQALKSERGIAILAASVRAYLRLVVATSRIHTHIPVRTQALIDGGQPALLVCTHGRIMVQPALYQKMGFVQNLYGVHSGHRDGRMVAAVARGFPKMSTIEGSTSRGGAQAIRRIARALKEPAYVMITPDGPRGPRLRNNSAVASLAARFEVPVVAFTLSSKRGRFLNSWDRFLFFWPFDPIQFVVSAPVLLTGEDSAADDLQVETLMIDITRRADELSGRTPIEPGDRKRKRRQASERG